MDKSIKQNLEQYLIGAITPPPPIATEVIVVPDENPDAQMTLLMAHLKRIEMCAKDLHYHMKGKPFYGIHLLADLIFETGALSDKIAEVYFLGSRETVPPRMDKVAKIAIEIPVVFSRDDSYFVSGTMNICKKTMDLVEDIKATYPDIKAGVSAVIDEISQQCLLALGFLSRTMKC